METPGTSAGDDGDRTATSAAAASSFPAIRRIVTGHDAQGRAVVVEDGPLPTVVSLQNWPGAVFHEVWNTTGSPAPVDNGADPTLGPLVLPPPPRGTRIRLVDFPPDTPELLSAGAGGAHSAFAEFGGGGSVTTEAESPHPMMHRTETVDYGIVIEGEVTLVLDADEVPLAPGSIVVQRGTNHAWANRSGRLCRMLFVLIDGRFDPSLSSASTTPRSSRTPSVPA